MSTATRTRVPIVSRVLRGPVTVLIGLSAAVFLVLAIRYAGTSEGGGLDQRAESFVDMFSSKYSRPVILTVSLGDPRSVITIAAVLAVISLVMRRWRLALLAFAGPGLTGLATTLLKPVIGRTIDGGLAFPSGHTGAAVSLSLVAALMLLSLWNAGRLAGTLALTLIAVTAGTVMALSLVSMERHYLTDAVGGLCAAAVCVLGAALVIDAVAGRIAAQRRLSAPQAPLSA